MPQRSLFRALALLSLAGVLLAAPLFAQDASTDSVAEAARHARAQKKSAAKPATVITDDTLKPAPVETSTTPSPASLDSSAPPTAEAQTSANSTAASPEETEKKKARIEALKAELAAKQTEVDLAQRQLALDSDAYYSKPNYQGDKEGARKIAAEQADLAQKKEDLASLKEKLTALGYEEPPKAPPAKP